MTWMQNAGVERLKEWRWILQKKIQLVDISCNRNFFVSLKHHTNYLWWIVASPLPTCFCALFPMLLYAVACIILASFILQREISNVNRIWLGYRCNKTQRKNLWGIDLVLVNKSQVSFERVRKNWSALAVDIPKVLSLFI